MQLIELRAENFKGLKAARVRPHKAVTEIVGKNGAGKTSVLDAVAAALGGGSESPELPIRRGRTRAEVILDLEEITVTRVWTSKGSSLEVVGKDGSKFKSPQAVLDALVGQLSFDPLAFGRMTGKEQAATLARIGGIDLDKHKTEREKVYNLRTERNRSLKAAEDVLKALKTVEQIKSMPVVEAPEEEVSLAKILDELKAAEEQCRKWDQHLENLARAEQDFANSAKRVEDLKEQLGTAEEFHQVAIARMEKAKKGISECPEKPDLEPIRKVGREAEQLNRKVRERKTQLQRIQNDLDQRNHIEQTLDSEKKLRDKLTRQLEDIDTNFIVAMEKAKLPIPGLSISDAGVILKGIPFSQCSGAEKLRVSVAIGLALNPKLKIMLIRDGSLLDEEGQRLLAEIAERENAQVFLEMVDTGKRIGVRIVDGEGDSEAVETVAAQEGVQSP
jgi:AAA domain